MNASLSRLLALPLLTATPALAQSYSAQIAALQPLSATASYGAQTSSQSLPAGQLPTTGSIVAQAFASTARLDWAAETTDTHTSVSLDNFLFAFSQPSSPGSAAVGPNELLVEFQPTGSLSATLEVVTTWSSPNGPAPSVIVDLGNDGVIDLANPNSTISVALPAGQIYQVRVVLEATLPAPTQPAAPVSTNSNGVTLTVRPSNNIFVTETVGRCMNYGPFLTLADAFANQGLAIETFAPTPLAVLVFGFGPLAALLPIPASPLPCILLPQPDVVMLLPQQVQTMMVPLPAAVRPATFHLQGVALSAQAELLGVSPGYTVIAQ